MTKSELMRAVDEEVSDVLLHASYTLPRRELAAVQFAMAALSGGLRDLRVRAELPARVSPEGSPSDG